jgi:hypothetical protein
MLPVLLRIYDVIHGIDGARQDAKGEKSRKEEQPVLRLPQVAGEERWQKHEDILDPVFWTEQLHHRVYHTFPAIRPEEWHGRVRHEMSLTMKVSLDTSKAQPASGRLCVG